MFNILKYILDIIKDDPDKLNAILYLWKRNNWMLDPRSYTDYFSKVKCDSPIFLLGNQGDGLTLLSRMIRRNPSVISISGNSSYWAGADEMSSVLEPRLTPNLSGEIIGAPYHKKLPPPRGWSYACNDLINFYRKTEKDFCKKDQKRLSAAIGLAISHHCKNIKNPRFIDKSQLFTVKMSFINKLLEIHNPYFIFITRNPYVTIYRAAIGRAKDIKRASKFLSFQERFQICLEHWSNIVKSIEEDRFKVKNFKMMKFEDFLQNPRQKLKDLCDFLKLKFYENMLPQPHHKFPLGIRFKEKWYPIRKNINEYYLSKIPKRLINKIDNSCGDLIKKYGYKTI